VASDPRQDQATAGARAATATAAALRTAAGRSGAGEIYAGPADDARQRRSGARRLIAGAGIVATPSSTEARALRPAGVLVLYNPTEDLGFWFRETQERSILAKSLFRQ
jgi:hypothetical protein